MKVVILAGGVRSGQELPGSGLPRALWPFPSAPLIAGVIGYLRRCGVQDIAVCANGKTKLIASQLADPALGITGIHYAEDCFPRGPAGCLHDLLPWLGTEPFIALQGAARYACDLETLLHEHRRSGAAVTLGARPIPGEAAGTLEPVGVYALQPEVLTHVNPKGYQDIKEQLLPLLAQRGALLRCQLLQGELTLIHGTEHYLDALPEAIGHSAAMDAGNVQRIEGGGVHRSARVHPTARLVGPVWIDREALVEAHAVLVGPVLVGPQARVGRHAVVRRAALLAQATVAANAEISHRVLGPGEVQRAEKTPGIAQPWQRGTEVTTARSFWSRPEKSVRRWMQRAWKAARGAAAL